MKPFPEPRNCPLCGNDVVATTQEAVVLIKCHRCGLRLARNHGLSKIKEAMRELILLWNTRIVTGAGTPRRGKPRKIDLNAVHNPDAGYLYFPPPPRVPLVTTTLKRHVAFRKGWETRYAKKMRVDPVSPDAIIAGLLRQVDLMLPFMGRKLKKRAEIIEAGALVASALTFKEIIADLDVDWKPTKRAQL